MMNRSTIRILASVCLFCLAMALVERVLQPGYLIKSAIKLTLGLLLAAFCGGLRDVFRRDGLRIGLILGGLIYAVIIGAFLIFRNFIDLDAIAAGIMGKEGISRENFIWVALYISIVNSLLEELIFRGLAYLQLRRHISEAYAVAFSALTFAVYHAAILNGWFTWWVYLLCMLGLFLGGVIFDLLDRQGSILPSWLAHAAANLSINTIGLMMYGIL